MRLCSIDGCGRKHCAKGFCKRHYAIWRHETDPAFHLKQCAAVAKSMAKRRKNDLVYRTKQNADRVIRNAERLKTDPAFRAKENTRRVILTTRRYHVDPAYHAKQNALSVLRTTRRLQIDPLYKFKHSIRTLLRNSFKRGGFKKGSKTSKILGCPHEEAMKCIGWFPGCHIHHVIFMNTAVTEEDVMRLNHYTNLVAMTKEAHKEFHRLHGKDTD